MSQETIKSAVFNEDETVSTLPKKGRISKSVSESLKFKFELVKTLISLIVYTGEISVLDDIIAFCRIKLGLEERND